MKVFKITGSFGDGLMDKKYGLYFILLIALGDETKEGFRKKARGIADELKKKYDAGNENIPFEKGKADRKSLTN